MLSTRGLGKAYVAGQWAVRDLTITIPDGDLVMLFGANGAGKSTTINCFLDFIRPTEGIALVDDVDIATHPRIAKQRIAFLAEHVALYPALTGMQNLLFFAGLGTARRLTKAGAMQLLDEMALPRVAGGMTVREYSKGMRQKLGLAIAWARGARNIILDEPTTGLDPTSARELLANLRRSRDRGTAVLMSTHDVFRAGTDAGRVYVMRAGRLIAELDATAIAGLDMEAEYLRIMADA